MLRNSSRPQLRLPQVKPWAMVAMLLATGLLGYYVFLGLRYWDGSQRVASLNSQVRQLLEAGQSRPPNNEAVPAAELQVQERRFQVLRGLFSYGEAGDVMSLVTATAREASTSLMSVALGELQPKVQQGMRYQTQPVIITLQGKEAEVNRFLSLLSQKAPATSVTNIRIGYQETAPSAQVQLLFYLSPEPAPEKTPTAISGKGQAP